MTDSTADAAKPDFRDLADKFTDDKDVTKIGEAALCAAFGEHMYRLGLAARPKVDDATNEIAHTKENADAARIIRGLRNIGAIDAIRLIEILGDKLGEERERVVSVGFPKHPLRGGVERVYTLEDIEPLLARAEAAEAKLTELKEADIQRVPMDMLKTLHLLKDQADKSRNRELYCALDLAILADIGSWESGRAQTLKSYFEAVYEKLKADGAVA